MTRFRAFGRGPQRDRLLGRFLADAFEDLGASYIKIGQILSSRPDVLSAELVASLERLQDQVAPMAPRLLPTVLEKSLGRPLSELFQSFDSTPVASASVAQVHRAVLHDGREIALKIRRPGIVTQVGRDLKLLSTLAHWAGRIPALRMIPFAELVGEVGEAVAQQLDFLREAENNRRLRSNLAGRGKVKIPVLLEELCSDSILAMEFVSDLVKIGRADLETQDREQGAVEGLRALYRMIFIDGFIHADMHPGNVFVRRWGQIVLLDLGLMAELDGQDRGDFTDFFYGMVTNNGLECARVIHDTATRLTPNFDRGAFDAAMEELIETHSQRSAEAFEVSAFVYQLFEIQRCHGVRGATDFTLTILSMAVYEGMVKQLHPTLDFQKEAVPFLITAKSRRALELAG